MKCLRCGEEVKVEEKIPKTNWVCEDCYEIERLKKSPDFWSGFKYGAMFILKYIEGIRKK